MYKLKKKIRQLQKEDIVFYENMQTGLEEDYVLRIFPYLVEGKNRLFGLFVNDNLASVAGYTIYADQYAMLGRLRSDVRFRGKSYGTEISNYVKNQVAEHPYINWVGANTEIHNIAAQKVLANIDLPPIITLYAAQAKEIDFQSNQANSWNIITSTKRKKEWLEKTYLNSDFDKPIFPFQAYYPLPVSDKLFEEEYLRTWHFYENAEQTRYLILWEEEKGDYYLHVTYPWNDFDKQVGFWDTIQKAFQEVKIREHDALVWFDLTPEDIDTLPENHPFDLPSPWVLHGRWLDEMR